MNNSDHLKINLNCTLEEQSSDCSFNSDVNCNISYSCELLNQSKVDDVPPMDEASESKVNCDSNKVPQNLSDGEINISIKNVNLQDDDNSNSNTTCEDDSKELPKESFVNGLSQQTKNSGAAYEILSTDMNSFETEEGMVSIKCSENETHSDNILHLELKTNISKCEEIKVCAVEGKVQLQCSINPSENEAHSKITETEVFKENDCSLKEPEENVLNLVNGEKFPHLHLGQEPSKIFREENTLSKTAVLVSRSNGKSKKSSTPSKTIARSSTESDEDAYIVVDEIESNVIDRGDEESPKKKNMLRKQQLCKEEIFPCADGQKSDTENHSATFKNKNEDYVGEIAEDAEAIEEEIDSWLEGISSDESMKSDDDDDDSEVIDKALETICKEEEIMNQKLSDSEEINSVLEEMCQEEECMKLSDSEAIDSVLKDICKEENENQCVKDDDDDDDEKLSTTDDGSLKDGIDIDSVIEAICDDEDEICSRVDSILKNKSEEDEGVSDSDAIVAAVDAISEEDGKNLICSVKDSLSSNVCHENSAEKAACHKTSNLKQSFVSVGAVNKRSDSDNILPVIMRNIKNSPKDNIQHVEKEVKSVLHALCNVVALQLDQMITSERIAVMESVLHQTGSEKLSAEERKSSLLRSNGMSSTNQAECNGFPSKNGNERNDTALANAKRERLFDSESHKGTKKQKLNNDDLESEVAVDDIICDDSEAINVSEQAVSNKISIENEEKMKLEIGAFVEGENTEVFDSASSAEVTMDIDSNQESKTEKINSTGLTKDKDSLVIMNIKSCTERIKFSALDVLEGAVCLPSQVSSATTQNGNENSSDSDRSFCRALKIEENLQNIIKSLSSPKHDSDMELDISTAETNVSGPEKVSAVTELSPVKNVKTEAKAVMKVSYGMFSFKIENKSVKRDITETFSSSKLLIEEEGKFGAFSLPSSDRIPVSEFIPEMKLISNTVSNMMSGKLPAKLTASNENSYVEIAEGDLGRFVRAKVHEHCMKNCGDTIQSLQSQIEKLRQDLEDQRKYTEKVRIKMRELATQQNAMFRQYGYNPKVEKRTVGVNVRIVQQPESKLKTYENLSKKNKGTSPSTSHVITSPKIVTNVSTRSSPAASTTLTTVVSPVIQPTKTVQANMPMQLFVTSASTVSGTGIAISPAQSVGSRVAIGSTSNVSLPLTSSVVLLPSSPVTTSASHQVVDLTDDNDSPSRHQATTTILPVKATMPVSGQLPSKATTIAQNLLPFPLMTSLPSMVQLLPTGTTVSSTVPDVNTIRMVRPSSALPPATRLAYFVPNTPGALPVIHQIGVSPPRLAVNVPPQQSIIQNMRQQGYLITASVPPSPQGAVAQTRAPVPNSGKVSSTVTTTTTTLGSTSQLTLTPCFNKHPAPLPPPPVYPPNSGLKALPPKPSLKMNKVSSGIVLSWNMCLTNKHASIATYQLYAYQENAGPVNSRLWKKVGDIKALPLPMACTLTQFVEGHKYHFSVRAIDCYSRIGPFSDPASILLFVKPQLEDPASNKSSRL